MVALKISQKRIENKLEIIVVEYLKLIFGQNIDINTVMIKHTN